MIAAASARYSGQKLWFPQLCRKTAGEESPGFTGQDAG